MVVVVGVLVWYWGLLKSKVGRRRSCHGTALVACYSGCVAVCFSYFVYSGCYIM